MLVSFSEVAVTFTRNVPTVALPTLSETVSVADALSVTCVLFNTTTLALSGFVKVRLKESATLPVLFTVKM